jgi:hypothetical protein
MPGFISDHPLARGLIRIGDEALRRYFASLRAAFEEWVQTDSLLEKLGAASS